MMIIIIYAQIVELLKLIPSESKNMSSVFKRLCQSNIFYLDDNSSLKYVFECDYVRDSLVSNINEPSSKSFKKNDTIYNCIMMIRVWFSLPLRYSVLGIIQIIHVLNRNLYIKLGNMRIALLEISNIILIASLLWTKLFHLEDITILNIILL